MEQEQRKFRADPLTVKRLRVAAGMSLKDFVTNSGLSKDTARNIMRGEPVFLSYLSEAVRLAFKIDNVLEVLHPEELAALGVQTGVAAPGRVLEWQIEEHLSGWQATSNGLQFQLTRLRHRFLPGRLARGKCFELRHMSAAERTRVDEYLRRHAAVCERIGGHANVAVNLSAALVDGLWWVLDRWESGETLASRFKSGPLSEYQLQFIMTGIAAGLAALQAHGVIRRELTPQSVLLSDESDRPILTDLELAKLVGEGPTVSPHEWPEDPYRAPEVDAAGAVDVRADVYSWGRIFCHAATGALAERGTESFAVDSDVPPGVQALVTSAVALVPSKRPKSMNVVLKRLKAWT